VKNARATSAWNAVSADAAPLTTRDRQRIRRGPCGSTAPTPLAGTSVGRARPIDRPARHPPRSAERPRAHSHEEPAHTVALDHPDQQAERPASAATSSTSTATRPRQALRGVQGAATGWGLGSCGLAVQAPPGTRSSVGAQAPDRPLPPAVQPCPATATCARARTPTTSARTSQPDAPTRPGSASRYGEAAQQTRRHRPAHKDHHHQT
jgi:hypothetical protein